MAEEGTKLFHNSLEGFKQAGIDIEDPVEMLLVLMAMNPIRFEQMFHSTTYGTDNTDIKPFYTTVLGRQTMQMKQEIIDKLDQQKMRGLAEREKGGCRLGRCTYLWSRAGGRRAEGDGRRDYQCRCGHGSDRYARSGGRRGYAVYRHQLPQRQALDYGRQIMQLAEERGKTYWIFMGGKLNAILPGDSEPTEIAHLLEEIGIHAENDIAQTVAQIAAL